MSTKPDPQANPSDTPQELQRRLEDTGITLATPGFSALLLKAAGDTFAHVLTETDDAPYMRWQNPDNVGAHFWIISETRVVKVTASSVAQAGGEFYCPTSVLVEDFRLAARPMSTIVEVKLQADKLYINNASDFPDPEGSEPLGLVRPEVLTLRFEDGQQWQVAPRPALSGAQDLTTSAYGYLLDCLG